MVEAEIEVSRPGVDCEVVLGTFDSKAVAEVVVFERIEAVLGNRDVALKSIEKLQSKSSQAELTRELESTRQYPKSLLTWSSSHLTTRLCHCP